MRFLVMVVVFLVALVQPAGASDPDETRIEYTSFVQTEHGYCGGGGNVGDLTFYLLGVVTQATGQAFADPNTYCLEPPAAATRLSVLVEDDVSDTVYVRVAQLTEGDSFRWDDVCGAGSVELDPAAEMVTLSLMPYGQTRTTCLDAGPPTHGFVTLGWS